MIKTFVLDIENGNGLWLGLPLYNDDLEGMIFNAGINMESLEVVAVTSSDDYMGPALECLQQESVYALNHLAQQLYDLHSNDAKDIVTIYLAQGNINYTLELFYDGNYEIMDNVTDDESLGERAVEYGFIHVPENVKPFFNYQAYGHALQTNDGWKLVATNEAIRYD